MSLEQRSILGVLSLIAVAVVMLAADFLAGASVTTSTTIPVALGFARVALLGVALLVLRVSTVRPVILATILSSMILHTASGVMLGAWRGQPETSAVVAVAIAVGAAALLPWGPALQAVLVSALLVVLALGEFLIHGATFPPTLLALSVAAMASTVFLARELEATRERLIERAADDAEARRQAAELCVSLHATMGERTASLNATKEEFVGLCQAASHDLRPPLRTMAGFSEILRETAVKHARTTRVEHLDRVIDLADAMGKRIDDILRDVREAHREVARSLDTAPPGAEPRVVSTNARGVAVDTRVVIADTRVVTARRAVVASPRASVAVDRERARPERTIDSALAARLRGAPRIVALEPS